MGIVFRQSIKTTLVTFLGAALGFLTNYFYSFMLLQQQFGFTRTIVNYGAIIQFLLLFGAGAAITLYVTRYEGNDPRRKVLLTAASILPLVVIGILLVPYGLLQEHIIRLFQPQDQPLFREFYWWIPLLILLWCYTSILDGWLIANHRSAQASFSREVILRVSTLLVLLLYYWGFINFYVFIVGSLMIYAVPVAFMTFFSARTEGFGLSTDWQVFSGSETKEIVRYSWYHWLSGAALYCMGFLDALMLASLAPAGMVAAAVYTFPVYLTALITLPYRSMNIAAFPSINKAYASGDQALLASLFRRSGINIWLAAVAMFLIIGCNLHNAVTILGPGYEAVAALTLILMLGRMVDMLTGLNEQVIFISVYYRFNFYISLVLVLMLAGFNWILIPAYGYFGAAWASTAALILYNVGKTIFLYQKMKLHPFTKGSWLIMVAGVITFGVTLLLPVIYPWGDNRLLNGFTDSIIRSLLILAVYGGLIIWLKPSPDLANLLQSLRQKRKHF